MRKTGWNDCLTYHSFLYIIVAKMSLQSLSMPLLGSVARRLGPRLSVSVGSGLYSVGYILTYFSVQSYFALAALTLALHGLAFSLVYATAIRSAQVLELSPTNRGQRQDIVFMFLNVSLDSLRHFSCG